MSSNQENLNNFDILTPELSLDHLLDDNSESEKPNPVNKLRKNADFIQLYKKGLKRIVQLYDDYPMAGKIYMFLLEHTDKLSCVAVSQELIAKSLDISVRSVQRATKYLHDENVLLRLRIGGSIYLYCFNPEEVWKTWDNKKDYALFHSITMIDKDKNSEIIRRLKLLYKEGL